MSKNTLRIGFISLALIALLGCNEQPEGRGDMGEVPTSNKPAPAAQTSADPVQVASPKMPPLPPITLNGKAFEDARAKLQRGQPFRFIAEWRLGEKYWRMEGQTNGRELAFTLSSDDTSQNGEWIANDQDVYLKLNNSYRQVRYFQNMHMKVLGAIAAIPATASDAEKLPDDFLAGKVMQRYKSRSTAQPLDIWLNETTAEIAKIEHVDSDASKLVIEFSEIRTLQRLPSIATQVPQSF